MQIFVRVMQKTIIIEVQSSDIIEVIKLKIQEKEGILIHHQRLNFSGKRLNDCFETIEQCNIQNGSTLYLDLVN